MQTLTLKAPAKINLYLNVLDKRPDNFHNIETIFEKIDLCDIITLKKRKKGIKVFCRHKDVPEDNRNLASMAAELILTKTNSDQGVEICIDKNIPVACGLGGGSSDAASVFLGLNKLLCLGQTKKELSRLAAQLGADIPFFILSHARAVGRGKGEVLAALKMQRKHWYVLVIPSFAVSTRRMYGDSRLTLTRRPCGVKMVLRLLEDDNLTSLNKYSYNSFERILRKKYNQILEIKEALKSSGAQAQLISGSGPCVFSVCATGKEAMDIKEKLQAKAKGKDWQVIVTRTYQMKPRLMERSEHKSDG